MTLAVAAAHRSNARRNRPTARTAPSGGLTGYHYIFFADEQSPESNDAQREAYDANQFLGIFTTAGENREDFTSIWD